MEREGRRVNDSDKWAYKAGTGIETTSQQEMRKALELFGTKLSADHQTDEPVPVPRLPLFLPSFASSACPQCLGSEAP